MRAYVPPYRVAAAYANSSRRSSSRGACVGGAPRSPTAASRDREQHLDAVRGGREHEPVVERPVVGAVGGIEAVAGPVPRHSEAPAPVELDADDLRVERRERAEERAVVEVGVGEVAEAGRERVRVRRTRRGRGLLGRDRPPRRRSVRAVGDANGPGAVGVDPPEGRAAAEEEHGPVRRPRRRGAARERREHSARTVEELDPAVPRRRGHDRSVRREARRGAGGEPPRVAPVAAHGPDRRRARTRARKGDRPPVRRPDGVRVRAGPGDQLLRGAAGGRHRGEPAGAAGPPADEDERGAVGRPRRRRVRAVRQPECRTARGVDDRDPPRRRVGEPASVRRERRSRAGAEQARRRAVPPPPARLPPVA